MTIDINRFSVTELNNIFFAYYLHDHYDREEITMIKEITSRYKLFDIIEKFIEDTSLIYKKGSVTNSRLLYEKTVKFIADNSIINKRKLNDPNLLLLYKIQVLQ